MPTSAARCRRSAGCSRSARRRRAPSPDRRDRGISLAVAAISLAVALVIRGEKQQAEAERRSALLSAARSSIEAGDFPEAAARLRGILEAGDSVDARSLWARVHAQPVAWRKDLGISVYGVAVSPDGRTLALGTSDGAVRLLDADTFEGPSLRGHASSVLAVRFSPDGRTLVSRSLGGREVRVWDLERRTSRALADPPACSDRQGALAISPDGARVAAPGESEIVVWDVPSGRRRAFATPYGVRGALPRDALVVGGVDGACACSISATGTSGSTSPCTRARWCRSR